MADIHISLTRNFTAMYNKLQNEYGEEFARINGFDDAQLNYTDFIDNFIDTETVADASPTDGSSNVKNKDARMAKHIIAQYGGPFCISSKYKSSSIFLYIKGLTA